MNLVSFSYSKYTNFFTYLIIIIYSKISKVKNASSLNNDFATFKNEFVKSASKDYLLQIDADELLSEDLLTNLKTIL